MRLAKLLMTLVLTVSAFAADINGKWKSVIEYNGQGIEVVYNFKVEASKLTGSVSGPNGEYEINEGKIEGDNFSFSISTDQFDVAYKGKIADGQLNITLQFGDNSLETIAKRT